MSWEWMGSDLTRLLLVAMGNAILIALGVGFIAYFERVIKRWEAEQSLREYQLKFLKHYTSADPVSRNDENDMEDYQLNRPPLPTLPPNQEAAPQ